MHEINIIKNFFKNTVIKLGFKAMMSKQSPVFAMGLKNNTQTQKSTASLFTMNVMLCFLIVRA